MGSLSRVRAGPDDPALFPAGGRLPPPFGRTRGPLAPRENMAAGPRRMESDAAAMRSIYATVGAGDIGPLPKPCRTRLTCPVRRLSAGDSEGSSAAGQERRMRAQGGTRSDDRRHHSCAARFGRSRTNPTSPPRRQSSCAGQCWAGLTTAGAPTGPPDATRSPADSTPATRSVSTDARITLLRRPRCWALGCLRPVPGSSR
jgi:hypothetical protein